MIYADTAATTIVDPSVADFYINKIKKYFGNPSSQHDAGMEAYSLLEESRKRIAFFLNCKPENIFFTSGGTESNNWVLYNALKKGRRHAIISSVEHPSIINFLKSNEYDYSLIPVDSQGVCVVEEIEKLIIQNTSLISVMSANNETGILQPVNDIAKIAHRNGLLFHTDAVQYIGHLPFDFLCSGADFVSLSGHKFNCPKGIGAIIADTEKLNIPYIYGGGQERGYRSGTQNAPLAAAMAEALELSATDDYSHQYVLGLRERLRNNLKESVNNVNIITPENNCVPGILNFAIPGIKGESLRILLNMKGICVSTGSACSSGKHIRSQTLIAMGLNNEIADESIRISLDRFNSLNDVDCIINAIQEACITLR